MKDNLQVDLDLSLNKKYIYIHIYVAYESVMNHTTDVCWIEINKCKVNKKKKKRKIK